MTHAKSTQLDPIDRLDRLSDLAAVIEVGLIGLRQCNLVAASNGLGLIAAQIHDELAEIVTESVQENKRLRAVATAFAGGKVVRS